MFINEKVNFQKTLHSPHWLASMLPKIIEKWLPNEDLLGDGLGNAEKMLNQDDFLIYLFAFLIDILDVVLKWEIDGFPFFYPNFFSKYLSTISFCFLKYLHQ